MLKEINNGKYRYYGNNHHQLVKSFKPANSTRCSSKSKGEINNGRYQCFEDNYHRLVKSFKRGLMQIEIQQTHSVPPKVKWKDMNIS
jgi:hypothetical protein